MLVLVPTAVLTGTGTGTGTGGGALPTVRRPTLCAYSVPLCVCAESWRSSAVSPAAPLGASVVLWCDVWFVCEMVSLCEMVSF